MLWKSDPPSIPAAAVGEVLDLTAGATKAIYNVFVPMEIHMGNTSNVYAPSETNQESVQMYETNAKTSLVNEMIKTSLAASSGANATIGNKAKDWARTQCELRGMKTGTDY